MLSHKRPQMAVKSNEVVTMKYEHDFRHLILISHFLFHLEIFLLMFSRQRQKEQYKASLLLLVPLSIVHVKKNKTK